MKYLLAIMMTVAMMAKAEEARKVEACPVKTVVTHVPAIPEANPAWVLLPFAGAVLLFGWRRVAHAS